MGHFGFSYIGLTFLLMLTVSNLIWTKHKPKDYAVRNENRILLVFERVGQVCVTCTALIFQILTFTNCHPGECWWIRYFKSEMQLKDFYRSFCGVPSFCLEFTGKLYG